MLCYSATVDNDPPKVSLPTRQGLIYLMELDEYVQRMFPDEFNPVRQLVLQDFDECHCSACIRERRGRERRDC